VLESTFQIDWLVAVGLAVCLLQESRRSVATPVPPSEYFGCTDRRLQNFSGCMNCADAAAAVAEVNRNVSQVVS
jgi:hypothetical protein